MAANLWRWIYNMDNGILNYIMRNINPDWAVNWLGTQQTALLSVVIAYVWMGFPFIMLMIVAAMQGIPKSLTEAAAVDGANAAQVLLHITLPSIRRILGILFVLEIINGFNTFDLLVYHDGRRARHRVGNPWPVHLPDRVYQLQFRKGVRDWVDAVDGGHDLLCVLRSIPTER